MNRRGFLQSMGIAGLALAAPATGDAATGAAEGPSSTRREDLATVLDISKCVACGACVEACHEINEHKYPEPEKPFPTMYPERAKVEDWSERRDVEDRLTPYNWLYIQTAEVMVDGEEVEINIPRRCLHCVNPPCANLCPWGAAYKQANGIVRINDEICLGGAKCRAVCPWHIPQRQTGVGLYLDVLPHLAGNGVMYKCDRCHERVAQGELPGCIEACPFDVQQIGPRSEMLAEAQRLAKETGGFVYGAEENGGTNTFYVSPVPFVQLNEAVEKGKGKPHLGPAADTMAHADNFSKAVLAAPLAGLAAGALTVIREMKKGGGDDA